MGKHEIAKQSAVTQDKALRLALFTFGILLSITTIAGVILTNTKVSADNPAHANASVNVSAACTLSGGATYVDNIPNNSSKTFGPGTLRATCNDPDGYSIYAIGYSNNTYGNTSMVSTTDPTSSTNIPTNTTGSNSWWAMQLSATGATIENNFDSLHVIPDTYTKVATKTSVSAGTTGESTVNSNYTVNISSTQAAGTYNGKVKYTLVHPNTAPAPSTLWQTIANMSKGKQTLADLQTEIATPTAESPISSNSGVYEYNAGVFGEASDATNNFPIFYYRGILDTYSGLSEYGADGQADAYPNYVKLANNTCWRIVRTTGSGGVKMIYSGTYSHSKCQYSPSGSDSAYNSSTDIVFAGYTYNNNYITNSIAEGVATDVVLGSNTNISANNTRSTIKTYIEDTWYPNKLGDTYTSMLEANAGYCNDRSYYGTSTTGTTLAEIVTPIASSDATNYFGARNRNVVAGSTGPSLHCTRGEVDIYRYVSGTDGTGNELLYPAALLTVDEMALAGSGSSKTSSYNDYSFLYAAYDDFWTLSPASRNSSGKIYMFFLGNYRNSYPYSAPVSTSKLVRPVISLIPRITIDGGSGTATDPWIVNPPSA